MNQHFPHFDAALAFLQRDPHRNRELLLALCYEHIRALRVVFREQEVAGVALRGPGPFNPDPDWTRLDAVDEAAVHELLRDMQFVQRDIVSVHRPWMRELVTRDYGFHATGAGVYGFFLSRPQLVLMTHPATHRLTPRDLRLVERSAIGWQRHYFERLFAEGRKPWAIIQDGRIVCRASSGYAQADSEEVVGVWTHPDWRGRGLARQLVSVVAADIFERVPVVAYTSTYDNHASQAVARAVGFEVGFAADSYQLPSGTV